MYIPEIFSFFHLIYRKNWSALELIFGIEYEHLSPTKVAFYAHVRRGMSLNKLIELRDACDKYYHLAHMSKEEKGILKTNRRRYAKHDLKPYRIFGFKNHIEYSKTQEEAAGRLSKKLNLKILPNAIRELY
jgi:hypothetical protein